MADLNVKNYLKGLTKEELNQKWIKFCKSPPPMHLGKSYLIKQIAWCLEYKSLSKDTQKALDKLVTQYSKTQSLKVKDINRVRKFEVTNGTRFIREFRGKKYEVTALDKGFNYNEKTYKSLSAIANEITGTRWNGKKFFGVD